MCQGLEHGNSPIIYLNISKNEISAVGMVKFTEALFLMKKLEKLDLSENPIGSAGIEEFSKVIARRQQTIKDLDISDCRIQPKGCSKILGSIWK